LQHKKTKHVHRDLYFYLIYWIVELILVKKQDDASAHSCSNFTNFIHLLIREDICTKMWSLLY